MKFNVPITNEFELRDAIVENKIKQAKFKRTMKIICSIVIIAIGVLAISSSMHATVSSDYEYTYYEAYGGDAYTGIQNAAADTANNVAEVGNAVEEGIEYIERISDRFFMIMGLLLLTIGVFSLIITAKSDFTLSDDEICALIKYYAYMIYMGQTDDSEFDEEDTPTI